MAIIKLGPVVIGIRGTVAGNTFSANKSGPYVKGWKRPPKTRNQAQATTGNTMIQAASEWVNLTDLQRADWDTWAAATAPARFNSLGEPLVLSGFNWFVELSSQLLYNGASINQPAPVLAEPAAFPLNTLFVQAVPSETARINFFGSPITGFFSKFDIAQAGSSASNSFAQPQYHPLRRDDGATNPVFVKDEFLAIWGAIQENRAWYIRAFLINLEGLRGPAALDRTIT